MHHSCLIRRRRITAKRYSPQIHLHYCLESLYPVLSVVEFELENNNGQDSDICMFGPSSFNIFFPSDFRSCKNNFLISSPNFQCSFLSRSRVKAREQQLLSFCFLLGSPLKYVDICTRHYVHKIYYPRVLQFICTLLKYESFLCTLL